MLISRPLPPSFLLPAWSSEYLQQVCCTSTTRTHTVRRSYGTELPPETRSSSTIGSQSSNAIGKNSYEAKSIGSKPQVHYGRRAHTWSASRYEVTRTYRSKARPPARQSHPESKSETEYGAFKLYTFGERKTLGSQNAPKKDPWVHQRRQDGVQVGKGINAVGIEKQVGRYPRAFQNVSTKGEAPTQDEYKPFPPSPDDPSPSNDFFVSNLRDIDEPLDESSGSGALRKRAGLLEKELKRLQYLLDLKEYRSQTEPPPSPQKSSQQMTLLEQLFPEEAEKGKTHKLSRESVLVEESRASRLEPLEFSSPSDLPPMPTTDPSTELYREHDLTIMILSGLSSSLNNADFQRIIPRGLHIEEWRGPGDVLKVIPLRDPHSLAHKGGYVLVFVNPAYARAYKTHIERLHALARHYTPTQLGSSPRTQQGPAPVEEFFEGMNVDKVLADYSLAPPSQGLQCRIVFPPYQHRLRRLLAAKGYEQITQPVDQTERAVVVSVEGHVPNAGAIERWLRFDGWRRGVGWTVLTGKGRFRKLEVQEQYGEEGTEGEWEGGENRVEGADHERAEGTREVGRRWLLTFEAETEARRFVRAWHRRPWPGGQLKDVSDDRETPVVNVEFLW